MKINRLAVALIFVVGALLRGIGLHWGLPTNEIPHFPSHPDEQNTVVYMGQVNPQHGDLYAKDAHIEGTLSGAIWSVTSLVWKGVGAIDRYAHKLNGYNNTYHRYVYMSRVVVVLFDLWSMWLVFLIVRRISSSRMAPYLGMAIFAVLPFEVIHSHFMRNHIIANTLILWTIYASLEIWEHIRPHGIRDPSGTKTCAKVGLLCGLTAAARYTHGLVAIVPALYLFWANFERLPKASGARRWVSAAFDSRYLVLGFFLIFGLFVGDMPLFLDFDSIKGLFVYQLTFVLPPEPLLESLARMARYITHGIPMGSFTLCFLFFLAPVYLFIDRKYNKYLIPMLAFAAAYFVPATKNYPIFALRTILPTFPVLVIVAAVVWSEISDRFSERRIVARALSASLSFILLGSFFYTLACVNAMARREDDPYVRVFRYFQALALPPDQPLKMGVISKGWDWYQPSNFESIVHAVPLTNVTWSDSKRDYTNSNDKVDFLILFDFDSTSEEMIQAKIKDLWEKRLYAVDQVFMNKIKLWNLELDYTQYPHDFRYPFPRIFVLRRI